MDAAIYPDHVMTICYDLATGSFDFPSQNPMSSSTSRPSTSKPRGVCLYYTHPRGCYAADKCKFLHGEPPKEAKPDDPPMLTPYDKAKRCRFYAQGLWSLHSPLCFGLWLLSGFCKRGDTCWFLHVSDRTSNRTASSDDEDEELCSICFEKPVTYGLLGIPLMSLIVYLPLTF